MTRCGIHLTVSFNRCNLPSLLAPDAGQFFDLNAAQLLESLNGPRNCALGGQSNFKFDPHLPLPKLMSRIARLTGYYETRSDGFRQKLNK